MSLFVGNLAFVNNMEYMDGVKIGVLNGIITFNTFWIFLIITFFSVKNDRSKNY